MAMPPDDWLCQKLERPNTTVTEGYPSMEHDSAGLKCDEFVPKSLSTKVQSEVVSDALDQTGWAT